MGLTYWETPRSLLAAPASSPTPTRSAHARTAQYSQSADGGVVGSTLAAQVVASAAAWLLARLITQGQPVGTNGATVAAAEEAGSAALVDGGR